MPVIELHRMVDSDVLHVPELKPLVGRHVRILISEIKSGDSATDKGQNLWDDAVLAAHQLRDYDYSAYHKLREEDLASFVSHTPAVYRVDCCQ